MATDVGKEEVWGLRRRGEKERRGEVIQEYIDSILKHM